VIAQRPNGSAATVRVDVDGLIRPQVLATTPEDGGGGESPPNCDLDEAAIAAAGDVVAAIQADEFPDAEPTQPEYGRVTIHRGFGLESGIVVQGTSHAQAGANAGVDLAPSLQSLKGNAADIVAIIHNYPPTGSSLEDTRNQAPSATDWALADYLVQSGADPNRLTLYVIDSTGRLRAYSYQPPSARGPNNENVRSRPIARSC
jgi:hypothetical protein